MRAVIDTNGLLSAVPRNGSKKWLYNAFIDEKFIWVFSNEIISEYAELVAIQFGEKTMEYVMSSLLSSFNHERFEPSFKYQLVIADKDDDKFVDCAVGANVNYLVSDDGHIKDLRKTPGLFPPIPILTFAEFRTILDNQ